MSIRKTVIHVVLEVLVIDHRVQRDSIDEGRVNKIASEFNPNALGALTVSLRTDGTRVIVDGMHRWSAAKTVGFKGKVTCIQYEGLELADEAALFLTLNNTKRVSALDRFRVRVIAGDKDALSIQAILDKHGWKASASNDPWRIPAITSLEKVFNGAGVRVSGGDVLADNTMHVITQAWSGQPNSAHGVILTSLGKFLGWYGTDVDYAKTIGALAPLKPMNFVADVRALAAVQRCNLADAGAEILVNLHNRGRRKNLLEAWRRR